jgi:hypothetical protein
MKKIHLTFFSFLCCILNANCQTINIKTPELVIGSGVNYGFKNDFIGNENLKLGLNKSIQFQIGARFHNRKNTLIYDCGLGLASIDPYFFIGKNNFLSSNAEDIYTFLPPLYEFPFLCFNLSYPQKVFTNSLLSVNILVGVGIKYLPKRGYLSWATEEYSGFEKADFSLIFDSKVDNNGITTYDINRKTIFNYYIGLNILPLKYNNRKINFEIFLNPSLNTGIGAKYDLVLPLRRYEGNYNFKFSSFGLKISSPLKKTTSNG